MRNPSILPFFAGRELGVVLELISGLGVACFGAPNDNLLLLVAFELPNDNLDPFLVAVLLLHWTWFGSKN